MSAPHDNGCSRTAAVLALYLDGDIGADSPGANAAEDSGFELVCPDALARHLRDCATCSVALQRARRLDAVLAENAGRVMAAAMASDAADRLLAVAVARATGADGPGCEAGTGKSGRRDSVSGESVSGESVLGDLVATDRAVFAPALLVTAAVAGLVWLTCIAAAQWPATTRPAPIPTLTAANATGFDTPDTPVPTAGVPAAGRGPERPAPAASDATGSWTPAGAGRQRDGTIVSGSARPLRESSNPLRRVVDQAKVRDDLFAIVIDGWLPLPERAAAMATLLAAARPGRTGSEAALDDLLAALARGRAEVRPLADALALAREDSFLVGSLRGALRRLDSNRPSFDGDGFDEFQLDGVGVDPTALAALTVAARLGTRDFDTTIQRIVGRRPAAIEVVAAALRLPVRDGAADLLLACWSEIERRQEVDGGLLALRLFAGQAPSVFATVATRLESAQSAPQRVRCLLALGSCNDSRFVDVLLDWATASCRAEAYAAAWSLGRLPHAWLDQAAVRAAAAPGAFVLRAALARAGLPAAAAWTDAVALSQDERDLLRSAGYPLFPRVAEWFRDVGRRRPSSADD
ncbi:MAG: hypothetical protein KDE27_31830 [Planctomycetes bacterium]|nr:hypothetical protein [Planctomycetota bacterium]